MRRIIAPKGLVFFGKQDKKQNHPIILHNSAIISKKSSVQWQYKEKA
jgi:hypothetical protein